MQRSLHIVCDDSGFASVDRGILHLARETGVPLCADYMIEQEGAVERARAMRTESNVSIGIHFELFGMPDGVRHRRGKELQKQGTSLGEQPEIQEQAIYDARRQIAVFRDALGKDPAHMGTHGDFHTDAHGKVMPWWDDLMQELFGEHQPPLQCSVPIIRHHLYSWNCEGTARAPRTPEEFAEELRKFSHHEVLEFVLHPALPHAGDASIDMLFTAEMRVRDVEAAIEILKSGVIEREGFTIVPVSS
jgi:predicted glycoside hydrolase/deacetylase ChbG (UPF0249 family)